ncbi:beta-aspartyl-peptidase, partial [Sarracenia purpurea var. burkii]
FTDVAYKKISLLGQLRFLDLCGAQNLTDQGLSCITKCNNLSSLNLTWCVRVTDEGVIAIAEGCSSLEFLSLFGITGVTDKSLEALSRCCSTTITTLDVNGCIGIKRRSREELLQLFPHLRCFKVHS